MGKVADTPQAALSATRGVPADGLAIARRAKHARGQLGGLHRSAHLAAGEVSHQAGFSIGWVVLSFEIGLSVQSL